MDIAFDGPVPLLPGHAVQVTVVFRNDGSSEVSRAMSVSIDGAVIRETAVHLTSGQWTIIFLSWTFGTPGLHEVRVSAPDGYSQLQRVAVASPELERVVAGHNLAALYIAFSPDDKVLASAGGPKDFFGYESHDVFLWSVATGSVLLRLSGHAVSTNCVAFSPDQRTVLSGGSDGTAKLWSLSSGDLVGRLGLPISYAPNVNAVAFSPNGLTVASAASDGTVTLWSAKTAAALRTLSGHAASVNSIAFSPDRRLLASASSDMTICVWQVATGALIRTLVGHSGRVNSVAFSPDSLTLASGSSDKTVKVWDVASGNLLKTLTGHVDAVESVSFAPDGKVIASGSLDRTVRLWDAAARQAMYALPELVGGVRCVTYSHSGDLLASCTDDGAIQLWDLTSRLQLRALEGPGVNAGLRFGVAVSPDARFILSNTWTRGVRVFDAATGALVSELADPGWMRSELTWSGGVSLSPDSKSVAVATYREFALWDIATRAKIRTVSASEQTASRVTRSQFSSDGRHLAAGTQGGRVELWDVIARALIWSVDAYSNTGVRVLTFAADGEILVSCPVHGVTVDLWDAATGALVKTLEPPAGSGAEQLQALICSPDGRMIATAYDAKGRGIVLWDAMTGAQLRTLDLPSSASDALANDVEFSPDGSIVAAALDSPDANIVLWDIATGELIYGLRGTKFGSDSEEVGNLARAVMFSPDGGFLVTECSDWALRIRASRTGELLSTLYGSTYGGVLIGFLADGKTLVTTSEISDNGYDEVLIWDLSEVLRQ